MKQNRTILLISNEPGKLKSLSLRLQESGYHILTANNGREGFRLTRRESPELIISEVNLQFISALELCRMIRTDIELRTTPMMFVGESPLDSKTLIEILDAGADECLNGFSDSQYLAAKAVRLIRQKYSENCLVKSYEILRSRQLPITKIIKDTAKLFINSNFELQPVSLNEFDSREFRKNISQKIDLGMNMISALANLLEEQMNTLETGGNCGSAKEFIIEQESDSRISKLDYEYIAF